jgi:hypothetical protein
MTAFFDSIGGDKSASVSVYAVDPNNRLRRSFLFTLPDARELTGPELMAQVLKEYGAGEYMAESRDDTTGQIIFNPRFEVGAIRRGGGVVIPGPAPPPPPAPAVAAPRAGDISAELVAMMQRQTAALEALAAQRQPSTLERIRELAELRELVAPAAPAAPAFDLAKLLELVTGVATLRDTLGGDGDGGGPLALLARSLAPALTKIAERTLEAQPALPAPAARPGVTDSPPSASSPAGGSNVGATETMLKVYVVELVRFAETGIEPTAAIERVAQTLAGFPESTVGQVLDWLDDENVIAKLAAIEPKAAEHKDWLEAVVDGVLELATEPGETPAPAAPSNGTAQPAAAGG